MRRVRVELRKRSQEDRTPVLPMDPRDPDVVRAKQIGARSSLRTRA
jgi:hypothetical protein